MSPAVTYWPAYLGLYVALLLAVVCNAFLDIRYGSFGIETLLWAGVFAWTLGVGWRQQGEESDYGRRRQQAVLAVGLAVSVVVLLPMWGLTRGGVYVLAVLQAANNCVTTTRRRLYLGLLVSVVMVMFAANHYLADWTMLFYLLPYLVAAVFTVVAEQISRRAQDIRRTGPGHAIVGGQGAAIAAATATILAIAGLLYAATPQITSPYLSWRHGLPTNLGHLAGEADIDPSAQGVGKNTDAGRPVRPGTGAGEIGGRTGLRGLPSPFEMRQAAASPGMPRWQAATITALADQLERLDALLAPVIRSLAGQWQRLLDWLDRHRPQLLRGLLTVAIAAVLIAAAQLLREMRPGLWLRTRFDYVRLGLFALHAPGTVGARQYFRATERVLALHGTERTPTLSAREYLQQIAHSHAHLRQAADEMVLLFETARYGAVPVDARALRRMREAYRTIHRKVDALTV